LLAAALVSLVLAPLHWTLALTVHMQGHLLLAALLLAIFHAVRVDRRRTAVCLILAIGISASFRPWERWLSPPAPTATATATASATPDPQPSEASPDRLRVLFWNVHREPAEAETILQLTRNEDVDVVALLELDEPLRERLDSLREAYPTHQELPREDAFGLGLYSRIPGVIAQRNLNAQVTALILRTAPRTGPWVDLWAVHTYPPIGQRMFRARDRQIMGLAQRVAADRSVPQIIGGDWNTTPWALSFRRFLDATGLRDASRGFGYQATWPRRLGSLGIPLDLVAVDPRLEVVSFDVPAVGTTSDHFPVLVELRFPVESSEPPVLAREASGAAGAASGS
jgi:endonuclease/exonuclease/phosphatase (EEP) superfamily protein YafD